MQINITGHHVEITNGIREAIDAKFAKLDKHFPDIHTIDIIVTIDKNGQTSEANSRFLGKDLSAKASSDDLYKSIAEMTNKLSSLMQRQKEVVKAHPHLKAVIAEPADITSFDDDFEESITATQ